VGNNAIDLAVGNYSVTIVDSNNCDTTLFFTISGPSEIQAELITNDVTCFGANDAWAAISSEGGVPGHTYFWSTGETTSTISGLSPGNYQVVVTDGNGCTRTYDFEIFQPFVLQVDDLITHNVCFGDSNGAIDLEVSGGISPYQFSWSNGATTEDLTGLAAGYYVVTAQDFAGCDTVLGFNVNQPKALDFVLNITNPTCYNDGDGSARIQISGGTAPYLLEWSNGQVNVQQINNLNRDTYWVLVTDMNGCDTLVNFEIAEPSRLEPVLTITHNKCYGDNSGTASLEISGAVAPYEAFWSTGTTGFNISNVFSGNYFVQVVDANGCDTILDFTIISPPEITLLIAITPITCTNEFDGSISVEAEGGIPSYTYFWPELNVYGPSQEGLGAGDYTVIVTDLNDCEITEVIRLLNPRPLKAQIAGPLTICEGDVVTYTTVVFGGESPYEFDWGTGFSSDPSITIAPNFDTLIFVIVRDNRGCQIGPIKYFVRVLKPNTEVLHLMGDTAICHGDTAIFEMSFTGNFNNYTVVWSPQVISFEYPYALVNPTSSTWYYVSLYDACDNVYRDSIYVQIVNKPQAYSNFGEAEGCAPLTLEFEADGIGSSYYWDFGDSTNDNGIIVQHTFTDPGEYLVILHAQGSNGCGNNSLTDTIVVTVFDNTIAEFEIDTSATTIDNPVVYFTEYAINAVNYYWSFGDGDSSYINNPFHEYDTVGNYWVTLITESPDGCLDSVRYPLNIRPEFSVYIPNTFTPNGDGVNESFYPIGVGIIKDKNYKMEIYSRWGELMFESHHLDHHWDGSSFNKTYINKVDTYVYKIQLMDTFGRIHKFIGHVNVVR
ncbi:MAG: gliding motility-associated-like protein, partial [Candidatus Azotimanducaceae bacterium]